MAEFSRGENAVLDGEIVHLDAAGEPVFYSLLRPFDAVRRSNSSPSMDERRELFERWRPVVAQALMESKPRLGLTCRHSILLAFSCFAGVQYERVLHE